MRGITQNLFCSIKHSGVVNKFKSKRFVSSSVSTYDLSTFYITLPHNLIIEKLTEWFKHTFIREGSVYLACNERSVCFSFEQPKDIIYDLVRKFVTLSIIFWTINELLHLALNYMDEFQT